MSENCPKCGAERTSICDNGIKVDVRYACGSEYTNRRTGADYGSSGIPEWIHTHECELRELRAQLAAAERRAEVAEEALRLLFEREYMCPQPNFTGLDCGFRDSKGEGSCRRCKVSVAYALADAEVTP